MRVGSSSAASECGAPSLGNFCPKDRNNYPLVQTSRIDGQTLVLGGTVKVNLKFETGGFGLSVRVGGLRPLRVAHALQAKPHRKSSKIDFERRLGLLKLLLEGPSR